MSGQPPELAWLLGLCRHDLGGLAPSWDERLDGEAVAALAGSHRLSVVAERSWQRLAGRSEAPPPPASLQVRARTARRRSLLAAGHLVRLAREFDRSGVAWTSLKGPALSVRLHGDATVRTVRDLDVIVPEIHLEAGVEAARRAGWTAPAEWRAVLKVTGRYDLDLRPTCADQPLLEIHTALGPRFTQFALDPFAAPARGQVGIGPVFVPTLVGAAGTVYVAWHGARGLWYRLCWLFDFAALRLREPDSAEQVLAAARASGAEVGVRAGSLLAEDLFGIALPPFEPASPSVARRVRTVRRWANERLRLGVECPRVWSPPGSYRWLWREVAQQDDVWRAAAGALDLLGRPTAEDARRLGARLPLALHRLARPYFATRRLLGHAAPRSRVDGSRSPPGGGSAAI